MSYGYGYGSGDDSTNTYNPRIHFKAAEKEGFYLGSSQDDQRTLFVGNLDPSVTEDFIATLFNQIGSVVKTKIIYDSGFDPYAFVEFSDNGQATQALQAMNRRSLLDKEMKVSWVAEPGQHVAKPDTTRHFHVFVGDLSAEVDNKILKEAFQPFGDISDAKVIRDTNTTKSKGYGFVSYPKREEAERAIEQMNGQWLGRRTIRTNWATRKPGDSQPPSHPEKSYDEVFHQTTTDNTSVYVGNIGSLSEDEIKQAFISYGRISEVRIFKVQGYAFVKYENKEAATKAILQMNGQEVGGQLVRCSWGKNSDTGKQGGGYGYGYGGPTGGNAGGYGGGSGYSGPSYGGATGGNAAPTGGQGSNANQQYWQYYAQYYNNPQLMQQWSNYWQQQQGAGGQGGPGAGSGH